VTREDAFNGLAAFDVSNGTKYSLAIKVTPLTNSEYDLTITDEQSSKVFSTTSKINPLADSLFNTTTSTIKSNQQEPDALIYYLVTGQTPSVAAIVSGLGGTYVASVVYYLDNNWAYLSWLYADAGFWAVVAAIAAAPEILSVIGYAAIVALVS
jgi:hypothetical protein